MNIPLELIVAGLTGVFAFSGIVVGFVFKVVFSLIAKNEEKSDEADRRTEGTIGEMNKKYTNNDRELYQKFGDLLALVAKLQAQIECLVKGKS